MKNNFLIIFTLVFTAIAIQSCSKKRGCNDENACNYDSSAGKYDGTCVYGQPWYQDLDNDGIGDPNVVIHQCDQPQGYVDNANGFTGEIATNFIGLDCDGASHNFYSEMDANTIIVMVWVMPCTSCIPDPVAALAVVQSYSSSHPGRVVMYLVDDYGNQSCSYITGWSNAFGLSETTKFSNPAIKMSDYGVDGMPKTVVLAGPNHQVYFNKNESTEGLAAAIDQALTDNP